MEGEEERKEQMDVIVLVIDLVKFEIESVGSDVTDVPGRPISIPYLGWIRGVSVSPGV